MTQSELLDQLELHLNETLKEVRARFGNQPAEHLLRRVAVGQWNAQECFAHLNAEFDYYLPRIELALHKSKARKWMAVPERQSNGLGRRAIRAADPRFLTGKKLRSAKAIDPFKLLTVRENELKILLINLELTLRLLRQAREVDLNRALVKPMGWHLSSFLLGDLFEYLTLHTHRHVNQALRSSELFAGGRQFH